MPYPFGSLPVVGRVLQRLGVNSVPAAGFFAAGWSIGTILLLYWIETVLVTGATTWVILRHRRVTRKAGHWLAVVARQGGAGGSTEPEKASFLASFLGVMIPFTAGHGLFVLLLAFLVLPDVGLEGAGASAAALASALPWLAGLVLLGLGIDLVGLAERPFAWVERTAQRAIGRMIVLHLTIVLGMFAMAYLGAPRALFAVFVGLKTLVDLGAVLPVRPKSETPPDRPPGWLARLGKALPVKDGETFEEHWRRTAREERRAHEVNEEVWPETGD